MEFKILLLGDGNFSFTLALAKDLHRYLSIPKESVSTLTATSFDSREELLEKYQDFKDVLRQLMTLPVKLMHRVNAWELPSQFNEKFNLIQWNHPHLGTENFKLHR